MKGRDAKMRAKTEQRWLGQGGQRRRRHFNLLDSDLGLLGEKLKK